MIEPDRFIDPSPTDNVEESFERALRPKELNDILARKKFENSLVYLLMLQKIEKKH